MAREVTKNGDVDLREMFRVIPDVLREIDIDDIGTANFDEHDLAQRLEILRGEIENQLKGNK